MSRPTPPMYAKVQRKVPPTGRKTTAVASPAPAAEPATPAPAAPAEPDLEEEVDVEEDADDDGEEEDADSDDEEPDGEESGGEAAPLSARQRKKLSKWSEEMSQRNLYKLAKDAGLDVRIRDAKEDLIQKIKDALG